MPQVFLFTGENAYAIREERRRWAQEFEKKHGAENLATLEGARLTLRALLDEVAVMPFLSSKRLVFVDGVPKLAKDQWAALAAQIHPDVLLAFVEVQAPSSSMFGSRKKAAPKDVAAIAEVKEFPKLTPRELPAWIASFLKSEGSSIQPAAQALLLETVGDDQAMLSEELRKLALHADGRAIAAADVEALTPPTAEGVVWRITDLLAAGKKEDALLYTRRFIDRGGEAYALWAILLSFVKNLALAAAAVKERGAGAASAAQELGVPFPSIRTLVPFAKKLGLPAVARIVDRAAADDVALKSGALRATDEAPQEIRSLIDRLIMRFP